MVIKDKDEVAKLLVKEGYDSENINGVVITRFQKGLSSEYYKENIGRIRGIFKSIGYEASSGFHIVKVDENELS